MIQFNSIQSKCQILYHSHHVAILEFTKVHDHLASIMVQDDLATLMMDSKFGNLQWDDPYQTPASLTGWRVVLQGKCISKTWTC